ncbi:MAG TPA: hypothetical protein VFW23_17160 [Tepidisphaeraceae bacterium]|nr:hypothetical protein [Tepidisphaeraceae bacterium]
MPDESFFQKASTLLSHLNDLNDVLFRRARDLIEVRNVDDLNARAFGIQRLRFPLCRHPRRHFCNNQIVNGFIEIGHDPALLELNHPNDARQFVPIELPPAA